MNVNTKVIPLACINGLGPLSTIYIRFTLPNVIQQQRSLELNKTDKAPEESVLLTLRAGVSFVFICDDMLYYLKNK